MAELEKERDISAVPPVVLAGALVVPIGLLRKLGVVDGADEAAEPDVDPVRRAEIESLVSRSIRTVRGVTSAGLPRRCYST